MKLTREIVDAIAPEHGRTSCNDNDLGNSYGGWSGRYDENTGQKKIIFPICSRCYLLTHVGEDLDKLEFKLEFKVNVCLEWRE
jgi:hypothetical protein